MNQPEKYLMVSLNVSYIGLAALISYKTMLLSDAQAPNMSDSIGLNLTTWTVSTPQSNSCTGKFRPESQSKVLSPQVANCFVYR